MIESTCERGERKKGRKKKKRKEKFRRTLLVSRPRSVNGRSSLRSRDYRLIAAKRGSLFCRDVTSSPCRRHRRPLPLFPCFHLSARPLLFPEFELTPRFLLPASLVDHPFPSPLSPFLSRTSEKNISGVRFPFLKLCPSSSSSSSSTCGI